jgi:hypothetical protein
VGPGGCLSADTKRRSIAPATGIANQRLPHVRGTADIPAVKRPGEGVRSRQAQLVLDIRQRKSSLRATRRSLRLPCIRPTRTGDPGSTLAWPLRHPSWNERSVRRLLVTRASYAQGNRGCSSGSLSVRFFGRTLLKDHSQRQPPASTGSDHSPPEQRSVISIG